MIISEEKLTQAILEYDDILMASLPEPGECVHVFSDTFERKMKKLIRKADHYVAHKALRYAASVLIAFLLSATMFLSLNSEARAAVVSWIKEYAHGVYNYFFTAEEAENSTNYVLGWTPEGYQLVDSFEYSAGKTNRYLNNKENILSFNYVRGIKDASYTAGTDEYVEKQIINEDFRADLYISLKENKGSFIVWTNKSEDIIFSISAFEGEDVLIRMAKSVVLE